MGNEVNLLIREQKTESRKRQIEIRVSENRKRGAGVRDQKTEGDK